MINEKLAYKIYRLRKGDNRYCFPLRMFLGENGLIPNHELKGKTFIEIETGVADQNEGIIVLLNTQRQMLIDIKIKLEETSKEMFKLLVLFSAGIISLIIQIVQIFLGLKK